MILPDLNVLSDSARTLAVLEWIQIMSQHPPGVPLSMTSEANNSPQLGSNDEGSIAPKHGTVQTVVPEKRVCTAKRVRAESDLTPVVERVRVPSTRRDETPFTDMSSNRAWTPAPSESTMDTESIPPSKSSNADSSVVRRRDKTRERRQLVDPEQELAACIARVAKSKSAAYIGYKTPVLIWNPDGSPKAFGYECTRCPQHPLIPQHFGTAETSSLTSHNNLCPGPRDKSQDLGEFGYTGGSARLTREQVHEYFALWMAESARPFQMVEDRYLRKLLHPDAKQFLPSRGTISKDIGRIYEVTQQQIVENLK
ncbi:hypothetical protein FRC10_007581, partial [Ceratobasidium sp. 414]